MVCEPERCTQHVIYSDDDQDVQLKKNELKNEYYNHAEISHKDTKVSDLSAYIQWLEKDSDKEFLKEFEVRK